MYDSRTFQAPSRGLAVVRETDASLSDAIKRLMIEERVHQVDICKHGNIPRNTLALILRGKTTEPHLRTLRAIAVGLATHPTTGITDYQKADAFLSTLIVAAGYRQANDDDASAEALPLALVPIFKDRPRARAWVRFITERSRLTADEIDNLSTMMSEHVASAPTAK